MMGFFAYQASHAYLYGHGPFDRSSRGGKSMITPHSYMKVVDEMVREQLVQFLKDNPKTIETLFPTEK
jgi:hypothetical protein